jgi:hypothetical protein
MAIKQENDMCMFILHMQIRRLRARAQRDPDPDPAKSIRDIIICEYFEQEMD